jgi:peptide/nickel transport system substrate-binding protein
VRAPGHAAGTLHVATASDALDFNGLDPALVSTADSVDVGSQIFERLVRLTADGKHVAPLLATRWTLSPNGTEWTFHLRRGVRFHDGTPFDAQAVVFSLTRKRNWMGDTLLGIIKKVEAIDPATVRIVTARPYAPFLSNLATYSASIVSPAAVQKHGKAFTRNAVGTGPYYLAAWEPGKRTVLERNAGYWGGPPRLSRLVFRVLRDPRERLDALESGAADVGAGFRPEDLPIVALHPQLRIHRVLGHNVVYVALNTTRPPFDDVAVRRAANHAVNRPAIVHLLYGGFGRVARGPVPPIIWSHHAKVPSYDFDLARARQMLAPLLTGRLPPGEKLKFYALRKPRPYLPDPIELARILQRNLAEVGLESELVFREYKEFVSEVHRGRHHLCLTGWIGDNTDPDNFLYTLLHSENAMSGAAANRALYKNPEYDALISRAQQSSDRAVREAAYRRAQELVARDAPWIPILHADGVVITRRSVGGTETGMQAWTHTDYGQLFLVDDDESGR